MTFHRYTSTSKSFFFFILLISFLSSCVSQNINYPSGYKGYPSSISDTFSSKTLPVPEAESNFKSPRPPWQTWGNLEDRSNVPWATASKYENQGKLKEAYNLYLEAEKKYFNDVRSQLSELGAEPRTLRRYQLPVEAFTESRSISEKRRSLGFPDGEVYSSLQTEEIRNRKVKEMRLYMEDLLKRKVGIMLKLGKSYEALTEINNYSSVNNVNFSNLPPDMSLLSFFAYRSLGDVDQALAWLKLSNQADKSRGEVSHVSRLNMESLLSELPQNEFDNGFQKWSEDDVLGQVFRDEKNRREWGGVIASNKREVKWFNPETYSPTLANSELEPFDENMRSRRLKNLTIGVLLPLSGRFADHAQRVKNGIELAVEDLGLSDNNVKLIFADTQGDEEKAVSEYRYLVEKEGASYVLGPLLYKSSLKVAELASKEAVPAISFSKRKGIPEISDNMFRLGVTNDNQVEELLSYSSDILGVRRFATLAPYSKTSTELAEVFRDKVIKFGGRVVHEDSYDPQDTESIDIAVESLEYILPDAIFLPVPLDRAELVVPLLERIKKSKLSDAILLGPAQWNDTVAIKGFGSLLDGAVFVTPFFSKSPSPNVYNFVKKYKTKFRTEPGILSAQSYDAASLVLKKYFDGIGANEASPREVLLSPEPFQGITGRLNVQGEGEISRRMSVVRFRNGEVKEVMSGGILSAGLDSVGLDRAGLDSAGLDSAGINSAGLDDETNNLNFN